MKISLAGISHRTAPLTERERAARMPEELPDLLREAAAEGAVLLATCNRVEIYATGCGTEPLLEWLARGNATRKESIYTHAGPQAVRHLFRVAASLDSLVIGENQILGQVRAASDAAAAVGTRDRVLGRLFDSARRCGREVRNRTRIGEGAVSVASLALELAARVFGDLSGRRVMLLGAGEMARAAAESLRGRGALLSVVGRERSERAKSLADAVGGEALDLARAVESLSTVDIVLASTSAPGFVLSRSDVAAAMRRRRDPLLLLDIAVPRDIDPAARDENDVYLFDMDDLEELAEQRSQARREEAVEAERVVEEQVDLFDEWWRRRDASWVIGGLEEMAERERASVWNEMLGVLGPLDDERRGRCEYLSRLLVRRILHRPIAALGGGSAVFSAEERAAALATLFGIGPKERAEGEE